MKLSEDQDKALRQIFYWYSNNLSQYITLGGYAGTGKTTLIAVLRRLLKYEKRTKDVNIAFCSYTGKGALVLKNKLEALGALYKQDSVGTIHGLIYEPIENSNAEIIGWKKKEELKKDLIIVDEASMVNAEIWHDLLSYQKPILAVGDHGQLPPISGKFNLLEKPQIKLEKVHRQVENNPIIKLSIIARETGQIPVGKYSQDVIKMDAKEYETQEKINELLEDFNENTLVLCGYNNTRVRINSHIRFNLGFETPMPEVGDRVICLRNNHDKQIFNGMLGNILHIEEVDENWYFSEIRMESGVLYEGMIYRQQFNATEPINFTKERKKLGNGDIFDFGYAITVHKAQGSEANRVILFEERFTQMDDETWKKWLYTGVTRAKEELFIVGNDSSENEEME